MKHRNLLIAILAVFTGGFFYLFGRPLEPGIMRVTSYLGLYKPYQEIREWLLPYGVFLPEWVLYSLPNGLWAFAYALIITSIWKNNTSTIKTLWMASIPILVFGFEFLQWAGIIAGTFCFEDLTFGLAGILLGTYFGSKNQEVKT